MKSQVKVFLVLVSLILVTGLVAASTPMEPMVIDYVGHLRPISGSFTRISTGGSVIFFSWVYKADVTDSPGQGAGISCEVNWSRVDNFGGDWVDIQNTPMFYNTDIEINDDYMGTLSSLADGKHEFTVRCTDDSGISWAWSELPHGNGIIEVGSIDDGVVLPGSSPGTGTGVFLNNGDHVEIYASGRVNPKYGDPANPWSGPDGDGWSCTTYECLLPSAQFGALIGRIGNNGQWFFIGSNGSFEADRSGELIVAIGDNVNLIGHADKT